MIVNYTEKGWEIITQRAHGTLAGLLAMRWKHSVRTARWLETLIAIAGHDDARTEPRYAGLLSTQGGPLDFTMTTSIVSAPMKVRWQKAVISLCRAPCILSSFMVDLLTARKPVHVLCRISRLYGKNG